MTTAQASDTRPGGLLERCRAPGDACVAGATTMTWAGSAMPKTGSQRALDRIAAPARSTNALGIGSPRRVPLPAATTMIATRGVGAESAHALGGENLVETGEAFSSSVFSASASSEIRI